MAAIPALQRPPATSEQDATGAAIARVLAAERDARAATLTCGHDAAALMQAAREAARHIGARAAQRSARVHDSAHAQTAVRLAAIDSQRARLAAVRIDPLVDAQRIRAAVSALATALLEGGE